MPSMKLDVKGYCRSTAVRVPNFSVLAHVSDGMWDSRAEGWVERSEKMQANQPAFEHTNRMGLVFRNRRHNAFKDQNRYDIMTRAFVERNGTLFKYYTTTFDAASNPLTKEDNSRVIDRVFDIPIMLGFNPQNELYARFGIQYTTKMEIYIHMGLFLELNYRSLREAGIKPICSPDTHNPIWQQRGYEKFCYYGYTSSQIFPKAGDLMKMEYNNITYQIDTITDELPEYEYKWRKYWWKAYLDTAIDNGQTVSEDVANSPVNQHFIDNLFGRNSLGQATDGSDPNKTIVDTNGNPLSIPKDDLAMLKEDILFRPPEVDKCVKDVTNDPDFYACNQLFGQW